MSEPAPKRRWLRFSLRTMFVVVTVLCLWLALRAICLDWIEQRNEWTNGWPTEYLHMRGNGQSPPWYLRLFGEKQGWAIISVRFTDWDQPEPELNDEQLNIYRRLQRLFPEAIISTSPLDSRRPAKLRTIP